MKFRFTNELNTFLEDLDFEIKKKIKDTEFSYRYSTSDNNDIYNTGEFFTDYNTNKVSLRTVNHEHKHTCCIRYDFKTHELNSVGDIDSFLKTFYNDYRINVILNAYKNFSSVSIATCGMKHPFSDMYFHEDDCVISIFYIINGKLKT